jgi:hypothetical protein
MCTYFVYALMYLLFVHHQFPRFWHVVHNFQCFIVHYSCLLQGCTCNSEVGSYSVCCNIGIASTYSVPKPQKLVAHWRLHGNSDIKNNSLFVMFLSLFD